jgi:ribosomal protein S12 methylthiotransferase
MLAQQEIVRRKSAALVGAKDDILLERPHPQRPAVWVGRSRRQAPVVDGEVRFKGAAPGARPGDFVSVRYTAAAGYDMQASVIRE